MEKLDKRVQIKYLEENRNKNVYFYPVEVQFLKYTQKASRVPKFKTSQLN